MAREETQMSAILVVAVVAIAAQLVRSVFD
jgi:hypothetical protein